MNIDKRIIIGILVAVIFVAVGVFIYYIGNLIIFSKGTSDLIVPGNVGDVIIPGKRLTLTQVKAEYKDSLIEFGDKCKITISPTSTIFKSGERIMLNNSSDSLQKFAIGDFKGSLNPGKYSFISFTPKVLPSKMSVVCGANKKTITIEAN